MTVVGIPRPELPSHVNPANILKWVFSLYNVDGVELSLQPTPSFCLLRHVVVLQFFHAALGDMAFCVLNSTMGYPVIDSISRRSADGVDDGC